MSYTKWRVFKVFQLCCSYEVAPEDEARAEFEDAGLDYDELEYMDPDERREMLEDTGLDPDDYDF